MKDLDVVSLYEKTNEDHVDEFLKNVQSKLHIENEYEKIEEDTDWLDLMEETLPYVDNIFRNPNRFIFNEEEIVKIELARRITVDSIKHLAKNSNNIQEVDDVTGDVKPSRILNINKEEDYATYENKLIYTLIKKVGFFISEKKKSILENMSVPEKNNKKIEYAAETNVLSEQVNISLQINAKAKGKKNKQEENKKILKRIEKLEEKILSIMHLEVYKIIDKLHITLISQPVKKTNLILKNTNFQYAMKLWEYIHAYIESPTKHIKEKDEKYDDEEIKQYLDETFLLDFVTLSTLNEDEFEYEESQKVKKEITNNLIQKLIALNPDMPLDEFRNMVEGQYEIIKYKNFATVAEIQKIFKQNIEKYLEKLK